MKVNEDFDKPYRREILTIFCSLNCFTVPTETKTPEKLLLESRPEDHLPAVIAPSWIS